MQDDASPALFTGTGGGMQMAHQQFYFQVLFSLPTLPLHLAHPIAGKHLHDSVYVYFHRKGLQPTKD